MICRVCGYEHESEHPWGGKSIKGDEPFINIMSEHKFKIDNPEPCHHGDYNYEDTIQVHLKACPKCLTVVLDKTEY